MCVSEATCDCDPLVNPGACGDPGCCTRRVYELYPVPPVGNSVSFSKALINCQDGTNYRPTSGKALLRSNSEIVLQRLVDTSSTTGAIAFDYYFPRTSGVLRVLLGGVELAALAAPTSVAQEEGHFTIAIPSGLQGMSGASLELSLEGPTGTELFLDNVAVSGAPTSTFNGTSLSPWDAYGDGTAHAVFGAELSAGCLQLVAEPPAVMTLGSTITLDATCCSLTATAVSTFGASHAALALLLALALLAVSSNKLRAPFALLVVATASLTRPTQAQSCAQFLQWTAQSSNETFSGTGGHFAFTPTTAGQITITLRSGDQQLTRIVTVVEPECTSNSQCDDGNVCTDDVCEGLGFCAYFENSVPCSDGNSCTVGDSCNAGVCSGGTPASNGTVCGSARKCMSGVCTNFDLYGGCCDSQIITAASAGLAVVIGQPMDAGDCDFIAQDRELNIGPCPDPAWPTQISPCTGLPTTCNGIPASGQSSRLLDCRNGSRAADSPLNGDSNGNRIYGYASNDTINANQGIDLVRGDTGTDTIHGGQDNDCLHGGKDRDFLFGDLGNDRLFGDRGNDDLHGGDGNDFYVYDTINLGRERCNPNGTVTCDAAQETDGADAIVGETSGNDVLYFKNAGRADVCLEREGSDLVARVCGFSGPGSVEVEGFFADPSMNHIDQIALTGQ